MGVWKIVTAHRLVRLRTAPKSCATYGTAPLQRPNCASSVFPSRKEASRASPYCTYLHSAESSFVTSSTNLERVRLAAWGKPLLVIFPPRSIGRVAESFQGGCTTWARRNPPWICDIVIPTRRPFFFSHKSRQARTKSPRCEIEFTVVRKPWCSAESW